MKVFLGIAVANYDGDLDRLIKEYSPYCIELVAEKLEESRYVFPNPKFPKARIMAVQNLAGFSANNGIYNLAFLVSSPNESDIEMMIRELESKLASQLIIPQDDVEVIGEKDILILTEQEPISLYDSSIYTKDTPDKYVRQPPLMQNRQQKDR